MLVMRNGGSTVAAERSFNNILTGYEQSAVATVWRLDFVAATIAVNGRSSTLVRSVGPIGVNLSRAAAVADLSARAAEGTVAVAALRTELAGIENRASPYGRWFSMVAAAGIGAALSQFAGGDLGSLWIAAAAAAVGQLLRSMLQARKVPTANVTLICGLVSACLASAALRFGVSEVVPVTLVASVVYLAPGLPLINGFVDMTSHRFLCVGMERIANAVFLFLVLAIAIALASAIVM